MQHSCIVPVNVLLSILLNIHHRLPQIDGSVRPRNTYSLSIGFVNKQFSPAPFTGAMSFI